MTGTAKPLLEALLRPGFPKNLGERPGKLTAEQINVTYAYCTSSASAPKARRVVRVFNV